MLTVPSKLAKKIVKTLATIDEAASVVDSIGSGVPGGVYPGNQGV